MTQIRLTDNELSLVLNQQQHAALLAQLKTKLAAAMAHTHGEIVPAENYKVNLSLTVDLFGCFITDISEGELNNQVKMVLDGLKLIKEIHIK